MSVAVCLECAAPARPGRKTCVLHSAQKSHAAQGTNDARRAAGKCVVGGCDDPPSRRGGECARHAKLKTAAQARYRARRKLADEGYARRTSDVESATAGIRTATRSLRRESDRLLSLVRADALPSRSPALGELGALLREARQQRGQVSRAARRIMEAVGRLERWVQRRASLAQALGAPPQPAVLYEELGRLDYSTTEIVRIAIETNRHPDTVRRWAAGKAVNGLTRVAVEQAVRKLGFECARSG